MSFESNFHDKSGADLAGELTTFPRLPSRLWRGHRYSVRKMDSVQLFGQTQYQSEMDRRTDRTAAHRRAIKSHELSVYYYYYYYYYYYLLRQRSVTYRMTDIVLAYCRLV